MGPKKWLCRWNGVWFLIGFETVHMEGFIVGVQQGLAWRKLHRAVGELLLISANIFGEVIEDTITIGDITGRDV